MKRAGLIILLIVFIGIGISSTVFASSNSVDREDIKSFILEDNTDKNEYIVGEYVCRDFALDVVNNARDKGIEAHLFSIHPVSNTNETHSLVVFPTVDGDVYVDVTQSDNWAVINFDTMKYETYSMLNNKLVLSTYIDWCSRGD